jgi:hypothetical protein
VSFEVEEGTFSIGATSDTTDVALAANVSDLSTAFVLMENCGRMIIDGSCTNKNPSNWAEDDFYCSAYLWDDSGTTKIRFTRERAYDNAATGAYKVIKCTNGEFSVQRGEAYNTSGYYDDNTISSVTQANCICWVNGMYDQYADQSSEAIAYLTSSTNVRVKSGQTINGIYFRWIVVEFDPTLIASVQASTLQNVSSSYSEASPLALTWSGDKDTSLLFLQSEGSEKDGGVSDAEDQVIGYILNDTTVHVWPMDGNASTNGTDISWGVVDFGAHVRERSEGQFAWSNNCDDDRTLASHDVAPEGCRSRHAVAGYRVLRCLGTRQSVCRPR